ncbi:MAG: DUF1998 domain-containing protein, partial [Candidatus Cloacimonetes bacterium]|nr:DUF1998 domain-containing protein [Candidatus Cloacimonadota bacterium]
LHRLRERGIVTAPFIDRPTHNEFIDYALRKKYINRSASLHNTSRNPREERLLPKQETNNNSFIDIIRKALPKVVISEARTIISELWTNMVSVYRGNLLKEMEVHDDERSYSINTEALLVEFSPKVYMCETCNKILPYALNGKCTDISCNGTVNEVNTDYLIKNKYGYKRVLNYPLLGMKTVEHTAQIDLNELTENEKHFTKGKINFLSSSTTMELGIDIGGLTSIFLSNCPPGPANYLQRAGRAGRRSDNTSLVVTNARRIPIDQYFFFKPDLFFTKKQHNPYVSLSSKKIISRHINAYILSAYFKSLAEMNTIAVNNPLKVFGSVEGFFLHNEYNDPFDKFFSWLVEHGVKNNTSAIKKLISNTGLEGIEIESYIEDFALHMYALSSTINEYYGKLSKSINKAEQENKQSFKRLLEHQQKYFFKQDLIRFLIEKQILPKYGFPVDIIQLNTKNKDTINKTTTRLERDISIAISEYAPGNTVIANKREIVSQGISTDFYFGGESFAENLSPIKDNFHYVICNKCNHFYLIQNFGNNADCPVCHQKDYIHATQNYNFNPPDSTPTRNIQGNYSTSAYIPKGFAVDYNDTQSYDNSFRDSDKVYSQVFPYLPYDLDEMSHALNGNMLIKSYDEATFYTINNGLKFGYAICLYCGRAELEHGYNYPLSDSMKNHFHLRKDKEKCRGISNDSIKRYKSLAAKYTTDAIRIRLRYKLNPSKYFENNKLKTFFRTLARTMLITSCKKLGIDERELSYTLVPFSSDNLFSSQYDIVIYDDVPGGAGYAQVIEEMLYSKIYYDELIDNLHCFENCKGACPACILDFDNIEQDEIKYNRHLVLDYFKQPIVKHMINSSTTSNGTIDNSRIIMHPKQEFLSQLQKRGLQIIELYFHEIRDGDFDITNKVFRKLLSLAQKGIPTHLLFTSDEKSILKNELLRYKLLLLNKEGADHIGAFLCKDNKNRLARIVYNDKTLTYSVFTQAVSDSESVASIFTKEPILEHCAVHAEEPYSPAGINFDINFSSKKTVLEISESQNALQLPWDLICTKFDLEKETKIKSIYYSDRYFFSKRQIISLLKTVHGMNYDELLSLTIASTPVMPSRSFDSFKNDNERVEFVKTTAQEINIKNVNMFSAKGKGDFPGSQHQREMLIVKNNDELIRLVFDKGMDLYKPKIPRGWNNKLREINTFSYQNNIIFLLEETKERNEYLDKRILDAKNKGLLI